MAKLYRAIFYRFGGLFSDDGCTNRMNQAYSIDPRNANLKRRVTLTTSIDLKMSSGVGKESRKNLEY